MLATELLFVYIYCLVDDAIKGWDRNTGERGREVVPPLFRADGERAAGRR